VLRSAAVPVWCAGMSLFRSFRARRRAGQALAAFARGWDAAVATMEGARAEAWAHLAVELFNACHPAEAERATGRSSPLTNGGW